jgi:hypothetical protein
MEILPKIEVLVRCSESAVGIFRNGYYSRLSNVRSEKTQLRNLPDDIDRQEKHVTIASGETSVGYACPTNPKCQQSG